MFKKIIESLIPEKINTVGIFTESTLKTSLYEELQKNGWCDIVEDKPDNLTELVHISIKKQYKIKVYD